MKVVTIVGARPQFIKAAVVSRAFQEHNRVYGTSIEEIIIHTGQHYDQNMSHVFFKELGIPEPAENLCVASLTHGAMTGQMLEKLEGALLAVRPDWVLVYGDTDSTLAGALAAKKLHLKLAHVEAGLRSYNMVMPEEQNRLVVDRLSHLLFCPTQVAVDNLKREGIGNSPYGERVAHVGDVMYDAALFYGETAAKKSSILTELEIRGGEYVLCTIHRAENTDAPDRLTSIMSASKEVAEKIAVILPLHPRTRKVLSQEGISSGQVRIIDPVSYLDMILLEKSCQAILTDSGGVQKEAYFFEKPCITLREETEWVELVEAGVNQVVGADSKGILDAFSSIQKQTLNFSEQLYGDGTAGKAIVESLLISTAKPQTERNHNKCHALMRSHQRTFADQPSP